MTPKLLGLYTATGFDMMEVLMKVATRKDPEIDIGKVDLSCAFVVCDMTKYDDPITYVSDTFERLTGYTKSEVLGKNCRLLQAPDGSVDAGIRRQFVDNDSVYYLKNRIADKEAQRSLINYRTGGQLSVSLLTVIPITGEENNDNIKCFVGFLVDLVERPVVVTGQGANRLYTVDYTQNSLPKRIRRPFKEHTGKETR